MALEIETYYALIVQAGIKPLCEQLYQLDRYPALRYMSIMEQAYCGRIGIKSYNKEGEYDEMAFSQDINSNVFDELRDRLKISPGKHIPFWQIINKIFSQQFIFIKNTEQLSAEQKIELLQYYKKGIKTRRLLDPSIQNDTDELINYIDESIQDITAKIEIMANGKTESIGKAVDLPVKKTKKERKRFKSFKSLFYKEQYASKLIDFLKSNDILNKQGNWIGTTNKKTEFLTLIDVLKSPEFLIIKFSSYREVGKLFASQFNIEISDRSLTLHTNTKESLLLTYKKLISDFQMENIS
ncbi:MAG: hypothetical protein R2764_22875 [Bacteroidales bacterium]